MASQARHSHERSLQSDAFRKEFVTRSQSGEGARKQGLNVPKRKYHTLEEAARFMSEPVERVRQRVDDKELPHVLIKGKVMIPALPLRDFYYDHVLKVRKKPKPSLEKGNEPDISPGPEAQKSTSTASASQDGFDDDGWLPSAFHAAMLADTGATEIYQLAHEGKVRTLKKGSRTLYPALREA